MLSFTWYGVPPAKSNMYKIGRYGNFYKTKLCKDFEKEIAIACSEASQGKMLFPKGTDVKATIVCYRPSRTGPDLDNIEKAIFDGINQSKVWADDRQVGEIHVLLAKGEAKVHVFLEPVDPLFFPSPLTRKEWAHQKQLEDGLELFEQEKVIIIFCQRCSIGIGIDCYETQVWMEPYRKRGRNELRTVCGNCADELKLEQKYFILDTKTFENNSKFQLRKVITDGRKQLYNDLNCAPGRFTPRHSASERGAS